MTGIALVERHDGLICDLDGVVVTGPIAVDHAVDALNGLTVPVVYATNNASRTPAAVGDHLRGLGVEVADEAVLTSSVAAARLLAAQLPSGSPVLAVGGEGVGTALRSAGLRVLRPGEPGRPLAVLQGFGPSVTASDLGEVAHAVRGGARWVATNDDLTLPTDRGPAPGNGSLVGAVRNAVGSDPDVIGKPHPPMYELAAAILAVPPERLLAVGDRLETDIEGAVSTGMAGALVLTGVHGPADAAAAPPGRRPTYLLGDLRELTREYPEHTGMDGWHRRGTAGARLEGSYLRVEGEGMDVTRASLDALWEAVDDGRITPDEAGRLLLSR